MRVKRECAIKRPAFAIPRNVYQTATAGDLCCLVDLSVVVIYPCTFEVSEALIVESFKLSCHGKFLRN